jgi:hypothetical protein
VAKVNKANNKRRKKWAWLPGVFDVKTFFFFFIIPGRLFLRGQLNSACVHIDSCPIFLFIFLFYLIRKNRQTFDFFFFPIVTKDSGRWIDSFLKGEGE